MKPKSIRLEVKDRTEGEAIARAMGDPATRAFVVIVGTLLPLSDGSRRRVLNFVADSIKDPTSPLNFRIETTGDQHKASGLVPVASGE